MGSIPTRPTVLVVRIKSSPNHTAEVLAGRTNSLAAISSAESSGFFFAVMSLSVVVITAPSPPTQSACRAGNTLRFTVPDPAVRGQRLIRAEHPTHPYAANWWPIGQDVGYGASFVNQAVDWFTAWPVTGWDPHFAQGARVQAVCDAMERSAVSLHWQDVSRLEFGTSPRG